MLIDVTGIPLTPGNGGRDCAGNGEAELECCCDECDFLRCCTAESWREYCKACAVTVCPHCAK